MNFQIYRVKNSEHQTRLALRCSNSEVLDLTAAGFKNLEELLELTSVQERLAHLAAESLPRLSISQVEILPPVSQHEIWAAGVTYTRSKKARMEESDFSANAYDRVYEAKRPELFFKCLAEKVMGPDAALGIRTDSDWNVPEPELVLVINSRAEIVGYTIGNDMSSRDIEGENTLYLPQAKVYHRSCALGPAIVVGPSEEEVRQWVIDLKIVRGGQIAFEGRTEISQLKRTFEELVHFLFRSQQFAHGAMLLTGTGIVPHDDFTLAPGDVIEIQISGIGLLRNSVVQV